ncbi:MAG: hypothetical protein EBU01_12750, partial [Crocinitomicaceae bacterium]|nr:hypothetical protein [Crocinitomicaceae bacterium]
MSKILIIGAGGQIGTELVLELRKLKGNEAVIAADVKDNCPPLLLNGPYVKIDALNREELLEHYHHYYRNGHCIVFSAGILPDNYAVLMNQYFGDLPL